MARKFNNIPKSGAASKPLAAQVQEQLQNGLACHQKGQLAQARAIYENVLKIQPKHPDALHLLGVIASQTNNHQRAIELIDKAIEIYPNNPAFYSNRGNALKELGRMEAAVASYKKAIAIKPDYAEACNNLGNVLNELGRPETALASFDQAIAIKPDYAEAHNNRGNSLKDLGRLEAALASFDKAVAIKPDYANAYYNRGRALKELGQLEAAIASYDEAIATRPNFADAYNSRGNLLKDLGQLEAALSSYDKAIAIKPDYAEAYYNRGATLQKQGNLEAAISSYDKAVAVKPDYAEAYYNRGAALLELKQLEAALASYDQAIAIKPDYADSYNNRGNVLKELWQLEAAIVSYDKAISLKPDYAEAYNNRGVVLQELKQLETAIASYDQAIAIKPYAEAYNNRGAAHKDLGQLEAALASYEQAIAIKPDYPFLFGSLLHVKMHLCDWDGLEAALEKLGTQIELGERVSSPFPVLALFDSPALQRSAAQIWVRQRHPPSDSLGPISKKARGGRIKLGYYSADFHNHAVAYLMAGLFELHDRSKFELIAFSFGPDTKDEMRQRVSAAFDKFIDVRARSDREVAKLSRELGIDIAVDLVGFTLDNRPGIFAERCAPIQVSYLGYPGTMGADYIDYILADKFVIPEENQRYYTEKVVYLPDCYQVNDSKRRIAEHTPTRAEAGLPEQGFVFCCLNNSYKITPEMFDTWMRLLNKVKASVLWLFQSSADITANLLREAQARGVNPNRLIFAPRIPVEDYLARYRLADLFLDTLPYNAGTTASDALWAGLPVLTCAGNTFVGRMASSLLHAIGLPELITHSLPDYEALALKLATEPERLCEIKDKLGKNRLTTPLFDTARFTHHLEAAYTAMHERYQADLPPEHIAIEVGP